MFVSARVRACEVCVCVYTIERTRVNVTVHMQVC